MKTKTLVCIILFLMVRVWPCAAGGVVRLASGEWPPYQSRELPHSGFVSRIVVEAFALEGIQVVLGYFPWKRSLHLAESGQWDGTFIWFDTPERRKAFHVSDPVVDITYVFFHAKSYALAWQKIEDLAGLRVGGTLGYDYGASFQQAEENETIRVVRKPSDAENFERLIKGQIHVFPCDLESGYAMLRARLGDAGSTRFTHHPRPLKAAPHHLLLSRRVEGNEQRMALFNEGLRRLRTSGRYDQFVKATHPDDRKP